MKSKAKKNLLQHATFYTNFSCAPEEQKTEKQKKSDKKDQTRSRTQNVTANSFQQPINKQQTIRKFMERKKKEKPHT